MREITTWVERQGQAEAAAIDANTTVLPKLASALDQMRVEMREDFRAQREGFMKLIDRLPPATDA